jgi:hypothetical protein
MNPLSIIVTSTVEMSRTAGRGSGSGSNPDKSKSKKMHFGK